MLTLTDILHSSADAHGRSASDRSIAHEVLLSSVDCDFYFPRVTEEGYSVSSDSDAPTLIRSSGVFVKSSE
ncbi:hypothetical protein [Coleofasciculus sp. LEGE 07092]|uniref:hypothetical protein n=1 Tax=Coleofasciculus sp. LEGE 07092 TaxID=2777969 RepID=UPI00187F3DDA|nr:hypothetical protein [Coleofasciculus sp. LEGE 07092]MBE9151762.1 hypothetical protein [Coleofasciculus sp. LEGE 07092]